MNEIRNATPIPANEELKTAFKKLFLYIFYNIENTNKSGGNHRKQSKKINKSSKGRKMRKSQKK